MSWIKTKTNYSRGVKIYLEKRGWEINSSRVLNKIMVNFLKKYNLPYTTWNKRYKGLNTADLMNAVTVQDNFELFKEWAFYIPKEKDICNITYKITTKKPDGRIEESVYTEESLIYEGVKEEFHYFKESSGYAPAYIIIKLYDILNIKITQTWND